MNNEKIKEMIAVQQEIIPVEQGRLGLMVDARLLHENLKINTRFNDWIQRRIEEYGFVEGEDFWKFARESTGGRRPIEYYLSARMANELTIIERKHILRQKKNNHRREADPAEAEPVRTMCTSSH